jgi:transcription initiation factor IIE alpha subunit
MTGKEQDVMECICRKCDIMMKFEEENPEGYFLYICPRCEQRVGLMLSRKLSSKRRKELEKILFPEENE